MSIPRKHHYLPQFYLRGFSEDRKRICQIEKETLRNYYSAIKDTAAIKDFHRIDDDSLDDPYRIEKALADIEAQLAIPFHEAIKERSISSERIHKGLVEVVSILRMRVPAIKNIIKRSLGQLVRSTGLMMERNGKLPPPPTGFEETLKMEKYNIKIHNWIIIQYMFQLASDVDLLNLLYIMKPSILIAPKDLCFITSDQPVSIFNPVANANDLQGRGIKHPQTEISLPLSNEVLLLLNWSKKEKPQKILSKEEVHEFNRRSIIMADSLIFTSQASNDLLEMIKKYNNLSAGIGISTKDCGKEIFTALRLKPVMQEAKYREK